MGKSTGPHPMCLLIDNRNCKCVLKNQEIWHFYVYMYYWLSKVEEFTLHTYIADFGLAKVISSSSKIGTSTMTAGTPGFQAPEQLMSERIGIECDIYAVGCVLLECFGEKPIWDGLNHHQIMYNVSIAKLTPDMSHISGIAEFQPVCLICEKCFLHYSQRPSICDVQKSIITLLTTFV